MTTTEGLASAEPAVSLSKVAATFIGSSAVACPGNRFGIAKTRHARIPNFFIARITRRKQ